MMPIDTDALQRELQRELQRQQHLLAALWRERAPDSLQGWVQGTPERQARGLAAYRVNAGMAAQRALAAVYPTVQQLIGEDAFAALARAFWHAEPPSCGDLAEFGAALPAFVEADVQLADLPYLADVARLDGAVHHVERAANGPPEGLPEGLQHLADHDPDRLWPVLRPAAIVASAHPIVTIREAHRGTDADRFAPVRVALAAGRAETAFVWRRGWQAEVAVLGTADAVFTRALRQGLSLQRALVAALPGGMDDADAAVDATVDVFDFERWLTHALQLGWLAAVRTEPHDPPEPVEPRSTS